jgi:hypothetical protein
VASDLPIDLSEGRLTSLLRGKRVAVDSRSHDAVIRVYDESGNVIETHDHTGEFKEW